MHALALAALVSVLATDTTFIFEGRVTDTAGVVDSGLRRGDLFVLRYTFDDDALDQEPFPALGDYPASVSDLSLSFDSIGPMPVSAPADLEVRDNVALGDVYLLSAISPIAVLEMQLTDFGSAVFVTDALPTDLDLEQFDGRTIHLEVDIGPAFWTASGQIDGFRSEVACPCDVDESGVVDVLDLLQYLEDWLTDQPAAETDGMEGISVGDLLTFLACWFPMSEGACG